MPVPASYNCHRDRVDQKRPDSCRQAQELAGVSALEA